MFTRSYNMSFCKIRFSDFVAAMSVVITKRLSAKEVALIGLTIAIFEDFFGYTLYCPCDTRSILCL